MIKVPKQRKALALKAGQLPPPKREAGSSPNKTMAFRGDWLLLLVSGSVELAWGFVRSCSKMISSTKPLGCSHIYSHKSTCLPTNMPNYMNRMNIPSFKILGCSTFQGRGPLSLLVNDFSPTFEEYMRSSK